MVAHQKKRSDSDELADGGTCWTSNSMKDMISRAKRSQLRKLHLRDVLYLQCLYRYSGYMDQLKMFLAGSFNPEAEFDVGSMATSLGGLPGETFSAMFNGTLQITHSCVY